MWMVAGHYVLGAIVIVFSNMNKRQASDLKVAGFYFAIYNEETNF